MSGKPHITVSMEQEGQYWLVITLNADGLRRQVRRCRTEEEARARMVEEKARVAPQISQRT